MGDTRIAFLTAAEFARWTAICDAQPAERYELAANAAAWAQMQEEFPRLKDYDSGAVPDDTNNKRSMKIVFAINGNGDACPELTLHASASEAWKTAARWLLENREEDAAAHFVSATNMSYREFLQRYLLDDVATVELEEGVEGLAKELDSEIRVEEIELPAGRTVEGLVLSGRNLAAILHGLRLIQESANGPGDCAACLCDHFAEHEELTDAEIDSLCEELNSGEREIPSMPLSWDCPACGRHYDASEGDTLGDVFHTFLTIGRCMEDCPGAADPQAVKPRVLITIAGGVGEVAENIGGVDVSILDYDNVKATLDECRPYSFDPNRAKPWKRDLLLSAAELTYIRAHDDAAFVAEVEAALAPDQKPDAQP